MQLTENTWIYAGSTPCTAMSDDYHDLCSAFPWLAHMMNIALGCCILQKRNDTWQPSHGGSRICDWYVLLSAEDAALLMIAHPNIQHMRRMPDSPKTIEYFKLGEAYYTLSKR